MIKRNYNIRVNRRRKFICIFKTKEDISKLSWIAYRGQHYKMVYTSFYRNPSSTSKTKVMAKGCKWMLVLVLLLVKKLAWKWHQGKWKSYNSRFK